MNSSSVLFKKILIGTFIIFVTIMHYSVSGEDAGIHALHRELYFVPILLAAFWFGLHSGIIISLVIGLLYSSFILNFSNNHVEVAMAIPQVLIFILIGTILGWLADKRNDNHKKEMANNNIIILGRAASAVAHEMKNILNAIKSMFLKAEGFHSKELDKNFEIELERLSEMVDILSSYAKQEKGRIFSNDINTIIKERIENFQKDALENGIFLKTKLDPDGCPSWIDPQKISWVLDRLIENAMEVSSSGDKIQLTTQRNGGYCTVSVIDEGPGIKPEHMKKIFSPFFTTKPDGHGLALAGCRKSIETMGGDISVTSVLGKGTIFTIYIPREYKGKPLAEGTAKSVFDGHSDSQIYRE